MTTIPGDSPLQRDLKHVHVNKWSSPTTTATSLGTMVTRFCTVPGCAARLDVLDMPYDPRLRRN